jgi:hypothetical protein
MGFGIEFYFLFSKQRVNFSNSRAVYNSSFYQVNFHHLGMPMQRNHMQQKHTALGLAKSSAPTFPPTTILRCFFFRGSPT